MGTCRQLIVGNWKMNGLGPPAVALAATLAARRQQQSGCGDVVLCPPATLLKTVVEVVADSGLTVGAQDCHYAECGPHTGDISAHMLKELGASAVIVGHSERRVGHGENDAMVRAKALAALAADLTPIVCVGEHEYQRASGQTMETIKAQARASLPSEPEAARCVVAYEPIWAIGSGKTPALEQVSAVHRAIRAVVAGAADSSTAPVRVLYGGSVTPNNAAGLLGLADVDGVLVGGASLDADAFWEIAQAAR